MEATGTRETNVLEAHLTSAAAFVEGGIQEACEDSCSICLEIFSNSDPSTVTSCKHEYHLQCILEWCQRSSQCPMCWQPISLKDPTSQELLDGVEQERNFRFNPSRNATIFHHPTLGDFELQHSPVGSNDAELEERIIQHLAAAAAMGRARHIVRREGQRNRSSAQGRPQFLVFSPRPTAASTGLVSSSPAQIQDNETTPEITILSPSSSPAIVVEETSHPTHVQSSLAGQVSASASGSSLFVASPQGSPSNTRKSPSQSSPSSQNRAGPSELQSFSESIKSRLNAVSMRCKESISKSTLGWKERLFSRNTSMAEHGPEVKNEVNGGIATITHMIEHLETPESIRSCASESSNIENSSFTGSENPRISSENVGNNPSRDKHVEASCAATSGSN